jgi:hypothetical protein
MDRSVALPDLQLTDRPSYEESRNIFFADFDGTTPNQVNPIIYRVGFRMTLCDRTDVHLSPYRN